MNKVSIIAGKYRHKPIYFLDTKNLRPTAVRIRETLFNWLQFDIINARVLDLFAGSGALAFEALSRGAQAAVLVEQNKKNYQQLIVQKKQLNCHQSDIICEDAYRYLQKAQTPFDIIFLDPPFDGYDLINLIKKIISAQLLKPRSKIYSESNSALSAAQLPETITMLKQKRSGDVYYALMDYCC